MKSPPRRFHRHAAGSATGACRWRGRAARGRLPRTIERAGLAHVQASSCIEVTHGGVGRLGSRTARRHRCEDGGSGRTVLALKELRLLRRSDVGLRFEQLALLRSASPFESQLLLKRCILALQPCKLQFVTDTLVQGRLVEVPKTRDLQPHLVVFGLLPKLHQSPLEVLPAPLLHTLQLALELVDQPSVHLRRVVAIRNQLALDTDRGSGAPGLLHRQGSADGHRRSVALLPRRRHRSQANGCRRRSGGRSRRRGCSGRRCEALQAAHGARPRHWDRRSLQRNAATRPRP